LKVNPFKGVPVGPAFMKALRRSRNDSFANQNHARR
jgi:hypothetical protein